MELNPGDMVYAYSVMNTLTLSIDTEFVTNGYYHFKGVSGRKRDEINRTCDAFIIPFADIFSKDWAHIIPYFTGLIRQLKIPCIVPCVGVRDMDVSKEDLHFSFDDIVKDFVSAVLDHSSIIGVRGEATAHYLENLGFVRERHFTILGCPTLYAHGPHLPDCKCPRDIKSVVYHLNQRTPDSINKFICSMVEPFPNRKCISQKFREYAFFALSKFNSNFLGGSIYYKSLLKELAKKDELRFFLNERPWMDFLQGKDFSIGCRIHGTLLSILAGTPAVLVPFENRVRELAEFHGVPMISEDMFKHGKHLEEYLEELDFSMIHKKQAENFPRYVDFWHRNGLATVFDSDTDEFPFANLLPKSYPDDGMCAFYSASKTEQIRRTFFWNILRAANKVRGKFGYERIF